MLSRLVRAVIAAALVCGAVTVAAAIPSEPAPAAAGRQTATTALNAGQAVALARREGRSVEVTEATTSTDTVTAHPNGSLTLTRHAVPVRKRVDGVWRDLDPTLRTNADGTVSPVLTGGGLTLSGGGTRPLATLSSQGKALSLILPMRLPVPTLSGATATYTNVLPDVDLLVTATRQGGFSHIFVIKTAQAAANPAIRSLAINIAADGVAVATDPAGGLHARDRLGRSVFTGDAPVMWDSAPAQDAAVATQKATAQSTMGSARAPVGVKVTGNTVTLTPDPAILAGSSTRYPVYIDPTWTPVMPTMGGTRLGYASVAKALPTSNKWNSTADPNPDNMQLGWNNDGWHARTMINFGIDVATLAGANITDAHIDATSVYSGSCTTAKTRVFAPATTLTSSNATWNFWYNSVSLGAEVGSATFSGGYNSGCPGHAVSFPVLNGVTGAVAAGRSTQTFVFTGDTNETSDTASYKELSLASITLSITYNHTPNTPANLTTSPQTACTGTVTTVGDGTVQLYAPVSDPDGGTVGVRYEVWKSSAPGTLIASTDPSTNPKNSGTTVAFPVAQTLLKAQAGTSITEFSWRVQITDGFATSNWSPTCKFNYDPNRPGAPNASPPADGSTQVGVPVSIPVTKPAGGTIPASYLYQLNAGTSATIPADANGNATITITPTRRTNTLTINSRSAGGNISIDAATITFTTSPVATFAADADLTGDGSADLVAAGGFGTLPAGVWLSAGKASEQLTLVAANIGINGNGIVGDNSARNFTGAQIITGIFTGTGFQDVLAYYPNTTATTAKGTGVIITGNGDGSALPAQYTDNVFTLLPDQMIERDDQGNPIANAYPLQVANAGDSIGNGDHSADLITIGGTPGNYHLNYYFYASIQNLQGIIPLTTLTPAGDMSWDQWRITTAQVGGATSMFLWKPSTGALYLWRNLDISTGDLTYTSHQIKASGWNTGANLQIRAADINNDSTADLWTTGANSSATAHLVTGLPATPTLTAKSAQALITANHAWPMTDKPVNASSGDPVTTTADIAGTLNLTATTGTTWRTGDTFSPDINLDGTNSTMATTAGPVLSTNADFSVSAWVKPAALGGTVLSQDGTNTAGIRIYADDTTGSWRFAMSRTDTTNPVWDVAAAAGNTVQTGVWTQLTATFNATSGMMNLAANGVTVATATHTTTWNATGPFRAGAAKTAGVNGAYFNGQLASLQTWGQVLDLTGASRTLMGDTRADIIRKANGQLMGYFNGGLSPTSTVKWDNAPDGYVIGSGITETNSAIRFADLNGDGFRDLIRHTPAPGNELQAKYNPGVSFSSNATWIGSAPWNVIGVGWAIPDSSIYFADLNGDGRDDIIKKVSGTMKAFYNLGVNPNGTMNWDQGSADGYEIGSGWTMPDSSIYFTDISGDGYSDIIYKHSDGILGVYYNFGLTPQKGIYWDYDYANGGYAVGWGWTMPDSQVYFADLTGEGRADIVHKANGYLSAYYNGGINGDKTVAWYGNVAITPDWSAYPDSSIYIG